MMPCGHYKKYINRPKNNFMTFCVCDGTLCFAIELCENLKRIGCTNIKVASEEVKSDIHWMKTKFVARGVIYSNNYLKMHGLPMRRKVIK